MTYGISMRRIVPFIISSLSVAGLSVASANALLGEDMNSERIELCAANHLEEMILRHKLLKPQINKNDKEPSWDGYIFVYDTPSLTKDQMRFRIPIQVKGTTQDRFIRSNTDSLSFPVIRSDLRNYYLDNGVVYAVVSIEPNSLSKSIYLATLLRDDLFVLLGKDLDSKMNTFKNIELSKIEDVNALYDEIVQFGINRSCNHLFTNNAMCKEEIKHRILDGLSRNIQERLLADTPNIEMIETVFQVEERLMDYIEKHW